MDYDLDVTADDLERRLDREVKPYAAASWVVNITSKDSTLPSNLKAGEEQ